jgi:uncharacterized membrane protein YfcA
MIAEAVGAGSLVGFTLGLVGGGGSILATPLLLYFVGVRDPHVAIGTSAIAVAANAYANLIGHAVKGNVRWRCALVFASVGAIASLGGSMAGKAVDAQSLLFLFGLLMLAVAVLMLRGKRGPANPERTADRRTCLVTAAAALGTGAASGFFGIGGGFLIVPALIASTGMPVIKAVGSSLVAVGTFGLVTAASYAWSGLVDWNVAAAFIAGGIAGGIVGMVLATRLADRKSALARILASLIFVVAVYVLYKSGTALLA